MQFNLNYTPKSAGFTINHRHKLFLAGSCFSENIGELLSDSQFKTSVNPSGILFNPLSIYNSLKDCMLQTNTTERAIFEKSGEYFSFLHHSSIKETSRKKLIEKIKKIHQDTFDFIKGADFMIITFGTAYYYKHLELDMQVANCHKQPGSFFEKKLLAVNGIVESYGKLSAELFKINPSLKIIYTVSPVKYLKDGLIENNISKSTLLLSVNELVRQNNNCYYFPAYELVTDDLRDYRFYKQDMAHPNDLAIQYVWQKFSETFFSDKTKLINEKLKKLNRARKHKPLHNNSAENEKFQKHISELVSELNTIDPLLFPE